MSVSNVLVVTNDDGFAQTIRDYLQQTVAVKTVSTRDAALDCASRFCPDLLLLDHDSSDVDCLEIVAIMRALRCRFECVLVTSRPSESLSLEAAAKGITHLLVKPFGIAEVEQLIGISTVPHVQLRSRLTAGANGSELNLP
jgi:DNA-binding response OmpR family regulator